MHVQNLGYPLPVQIEDPKPPVSTIHNLMATLMAYIFRTKHGTDNRASVLQTTTGLLYSLKTT